MLFASFKLNEAHKLDNIQFSLRYETGHLVEG